MSASSHREPRRPRGAWMLLVSVALARPVAAEPCRVELSGADRQSWEQAARALEAALGRYTEQSPCARVALRAEHGAATVVFTTADGRRAERRIEHPIELGPTVEALSVTPHLGAEEPSTLVEASAAPPSKDVETARADEGSNRPERDRSVVARPGSLPASDARPASGTVDPPSPYELFPIFGAQIGFRAGADRLISPIIGGSAALLLDSWELGLLGRYEAHYVDAGGGNDGSPETSGATLGATVGLRAPLGRLALRGGGMLLIAALHEDSGAKNGRAEARLGTYFGGVWPMNSPTRFRLDLGAELVPYNIGRSERNALEQYSLPWWALSLALGAEFG